MQFILRQLNSWKAARTIYSYVILCGRRLGCKSVLLGGHPSSGRPCNWPTESYQRFFRHISATWSFRKCRGRRICRWSVTMMTGSGPFRYCIVWLLQGSSLHGMATTSWLISFVPLPNKSSRSEIWFFEFWRCICKHWLIVVAIWATTIFLLAVHGRYASCSSS